MKNTLVRDLRPPMRVHDVFLVVEKKTAATRDGRPYVHLVLRDRTGTIRAVKWDADLQAFESIETGDYVEVRGDVSTHQDTPQIKIEAIRKHTDAVDPLDFLPQSSKDADQMMAEIFRLVESVQNPMLARLLRAFFDDQELVVRFKSAPAALKVHHAYLGGLLEHTLSVTQLCDMVSRHYPQLDRDLLVSGALLHDIGKIEEMSWTTAIQLTDSGNFVGHVVAGAMSVDRVISAIPGFDPSLRMKVLHLLLSHHGKREFGAPVLPGMRESLVLHYVEDMDAKVKMFDEAVAEGGDEPWTAFHNKFERHLYRGRREEPGGAPAEILDSDEDADYDPFADE